MKAVFKVAAVIPILKLAAVRLTIAQQRKLHWYGWGAETWGAQKIYTATSD